MTIAHWPAHVVGSTRLPVRVPLAARLKVGQFLEQLRHKLELLIQYLSLGRVHRGPNHRVELVVDGISGVHDGVF